MIKITDYEIIEGSRATTVLVTRKGVTYKNSHDYMHKERDLELVMNAHGIGICENNKPLHWISLPYIVRFIDGEQVGKYDKARRHE